MARSQTGAPTARSVRGGVETQLPPDLQPTQVNVAHDPTYRTPAYRYGEPQVAVNPRNPNNLIYAVVGVGFTYACQAAKDPSCEMVQRPPFGPGPRGQFTRNDFTVMPVFVSFDRGKTWKRVPFPRHPPGRPEMHTQGDPMVTVGPDGTFYVGWDAINWGTPENVLPSGGIGVSKSTDGGLTWSEPVLTGTPVDRPWLTTDLATGTIYEVSTGNLGPRASGDPKTVAGSISDRWVVASKDGVKWTTPQRLGGSDGNGAFSTGFATIISAAHGAVATAFFQKDPKACGFFVGGGAPCVVFQTSTDAGATWKRHRVPVSSSSGNPMVAANPAKKGHFTVAVPNGMSTQFQVYQTADSGSTWTGPTMVAQDATKTHFKPWLAYSPQGALGLMWRTNQPGPGPTFPYNVWAAISRDGGATFSEPLQISTADSPAPQAGPFGNSADDASHLALDRDFAYIVWADWRSGERTGAFFSAVKLEAFTHASRGAGRR